MTTLKQTRKALGLSAPWVAKNLAGGMPPRSYLNQESGTYAAHEDVIANMSDAQETISALIERCAARTASVKGLKP